MIKEIKIVGVEIETKEGITTYEVGKSGTSDISYHIESGSLLVLHNGRAYRYVGYKLIITYDHSL